jgi:hypothetical protein
VLLQVGLEANQLAPCRTIKVTHDEERKMEKHTAKSHRSPSVLHTSTMSKRKLPDGIPTSSVTAVVQPISNPVDADGEAVQANAAAQQSVMPETPPRRIQKGSPADEFLNTLPQTVGQVDGLTCNLALIPKEQYNKRRTLVAVIIAVDQIKTKGSFSRRNVVLRDSHHECEVCVWGNHTHLLNASSIGRPVTFSRICLTEFAEKVSIHMPKDSSVNLGSSPETVPVMQWFNQTGNTSITVAAALEYPKSDVIAIVGILGRIVSEIVTSKDGQTENVTTFYIVAGPPQAVMTITFINPKPDKIENCQVRMMLNNYYSTKTHFQSYLHRVVKISKVRCEVLPTGPRFTSIGGITFVTPTEECPTDLSTWWLNKKTEAIED